MFNKDNVILEINNVSKQFKASGNRILKACDDINLKVLKGKTLGIVGESRCGKSTLARIFIQLEGATSGEVILISKVLSLLIIISFNLQMLHYKIIFK